MICNKCGAEIGKKDKFCTKCGLELKKSKHKKKDITEVEEYKLKDKEIEKLSQSFVSQNEKYIASLGNGYIMNYLANGSMRNGFAFVSDKRVYFKGSCLSGTGKHLVKKNEERTVDVKNITGSGFTYHREWGKLLWMFIPILIFIGIIIALIFWKSQCPKTATFIPETATEIEYQNDGERVRYYIPEKRIYYHTVVYSFKDLVRDRAIFIGGITIASAVFLAVIIIMKNYLLGRKTLFRIEYAGGCIAFDVSFYAKAEIDDFQRQLRRAKDLVEETSTVKTVAVDETVQSSAQGSMPDELRKYADLMNEGLISREEYEAMKKKVLGL